MPEKGCQGHALLEARQPMTLDLPSNPAVPVALAREAERVARRLGLPLPELEAALGSEAACRAFLRAHQHQPSVLRVRPLPRRRPVAC